MPTKTAIKRELKRYFPKYKFLVDVSPTSINIVICNGPKDFKSLLHGSTHTDVNVYHIPNYEEHGPFLQKILNIATTGDANERISLYNFPKHVIMKIGNWHEPYQIKENKVNLFDRIVTFLYGTVAVGSLFAGSIQAATYMPVATWPLLFLTIGGLIWFSLYLYWDYILYSSHD